MMQALLLLCVCIGVWSEALEAHKHKGCFSAEELQGGVQRLLRRTRYPTEEELMRLTPVESKKRCPVSLQEHLIDYSQRSVSPWRYIIDRMEGRFPERIAVAECLCKGCLITRSGHQAENHDYNSVPIMQTQMVLKKTKCHNDTGKYSLSSHFIQVPIACTCVKYRSSA
ncbi:hypothetical protein DPEC_G00215250 [Dallia pectoralis]|uniref:Uncharacterized protein n=1 Tax=Dallia pectoralis TaxID=75939 RepID=A0ACC2G2A1_DALPE|nr:hypothetical protein DPEC_G00215250 [Dallia pectoralis]